MVLTARALNREESLGLALAVLGHGALVAWLVLQRPAVTLPPPPERMEVTISDETGPVSTSPEPQAAPMPDKGPELGEAPPAPEPQPVVKPEPAPPRPAPAPTLVKPVPPKPAPPKVAAKPAQVPPKAPPRVAAKPGASAFDRDFGAGIPAAVPGKSKNPPAAVASTQLVASWDSSIKSKVLRRWNSCPVSGLDISILRATVRFTLDRNGGILSIEEPVVTGITDANRAQVRPFKDCAIKAIKLAAPFSGMPVEFYDQWKPRKLNFTK